MMKKTMTILGISLGTREIGVAVLTDNELVHWQRHRFMDSWSDVKAVQMIRKLEWHVGVHYVDQVIIKVPPKKDQGTNLRYLLDRITVLLKSHDCTVEVATKEELKAIAPEAVNRSQLIQYVTECYPILQPEKEQQERNSSPVHIKMFEAVFAAHVTMKASKE